MTGMALTGVGKNGLVAWQFADLAAFEGLCHGVFGRRGGVSTGPFASLNVSFICGDLPENVVRNRTRVARWTGLQEAVYLNQVHGDTVQVITRDTVAAGLPTATADAVVTDARQQLLVIQVADCQAVMLFDPVRRVIANVHSGWRGSVCNILGKTVDVMVRRFGCRADDLRAAIGPSLGPCCAEFVHYRRELPRLFWPYQDQRHRFDFWAISRDQLTAAGLQPDFIVHSGICTRCRSEEFYSYRASHRTGRFAVAIGLK